MRTIPTLAIVLASFISLQSDVCAGPYHIQPLDGDELDRLISFQSTSEIFPDAWREEPFQVEAEPVPEQQRRRAKRVVRRAVKNYPAELISNSLEHIYLLGELTVYRRQQFAGTAHENAVYLVLQPEKDGFSDRFIRRNFHREFSTTLLNRHRDLFPFDQWKEVNGSNHSYLGGNSWDEHESRKNEGGARAISTGQTSLSLTENSSKLKRGLLTEYSASSLENDVNEYAARLFDGSSRFWKVVEEFDGVRRKSKLVISFYRSLHPKLTEEYFRGHED